MTVTLEQLEKWMTDAEGENLEFKEAHSSFSHDRLIEYCIALANEGGGKFILGVNDAIPRAVVGTGAFRNLNEVKSKIIDTIHLRVEIDEVSHADGRVLVFHIPSRPIASPLEIKGKFLMRVGEDLRPMTPEQLKVIFDEAIADYSAETVRSIDISSLSVDAIERFRLLLIEHSRNTEYSSLSVERLLSDTGLLVDGKVTNAALILFGTEPALSQHLSTSEVIFEYRNNEALTPVNQRINFQRGFFLYFDELIHAINLRNDEHNYIDGLVRRTIKTFNKHVIREALLNAVGHRDYRAPGSVFIRQYPRTMEISSPGGFPQGITIENIIEKQVPRNKLISSTFEKCGFVERSGQGVDQMFRMSIQEGKLPPDFSKSDDYEVRLILNGVVQDESFVKFIEKLSGESQRPFSVEDFIVLDQVRRTQRVEERFRNRIPFLREVGAIELIGRGRGTKYILSRSYHHLTDQPGKYTRRIGLDREQNKALLEKHIIQNPGCRFSELQQVLSELSRRQVQRMLEDLKGEGRILVKGQRKTALWYPGPDPES